MSGTARQDLAGRRVLVVEDEYMIADELAGILSDAGADMLGPVGSVAEALRLVAAEPRIDGAVLDVNVQGQKIWPVVDVLQARGVPLILTTGYDAGAIPAAYIGLLRCEKPASERDLLRTLSRVLVA